MGLNVLNTVQTGLLRLENLILTGKVLDTTGGLVEDNSTSAGIIDNDYIARLLNEEGAAAEGGALWPVLQLIYNLGGGGMTVGKAVAIYAVGGGFIVSGIMLALNGGDTQAQAKNKAGMGYRTLGAIVAFAAGGIVMVLNTIALSVFTN